MREQTEVDGEFALEKEKKATNAIYVYTIENKTTDIPLQTKQQKKNKTTITILYFLLKPFWLKWLKFELCLCVRVLFAQVAQVAQVHTQWSFRLRLRWSFHLCVWVLFVRACGLCLCVIVGSVGACLWAPFVRVGSLCACGLHLCLVW